MTITRPWAFWVDDGNVRLDGKLNVNQEASTTVAQVWFKASAPGLVGLVIEGATSQTAHLQDWRDGPASLKAYCKADGVFLMPRIMFGETVAAGEEPVSSDVSAWSEQSFGILRSSGGTRIFSIYKNATDVYQKELLPVAAKVKLTPEGGFAVKVVAGEAVALGEVVYSKVSGGADGKVWLNPIDGDMPIGVVYAAAAADADLWVVTSGIASVLPNAADTATRGYVIVSSSTTAGRVDQSATVPSAATHFREVGHWIDTGSGAGAATRAIVHFN
jgi:hypothetical protein